MRLSPDLVDMFVQELNGLAGRYGFALKRGPQFTVTRQAYHPLRPGLPNWEGIGTRTTDIDLDFSYTYTEHVETPCKY